MKNLYYQTDPRHFRVRFWIHNSHEFFGLARQCLFRGLWRHLHEKSLATHSIDYLDSENDGELV